MQYFTSNEYNTKYGSSISEVKIEEACEMIYAQVSQIQRGDWNAENVPTPIKNASMEQARFLLEQDIPHVDTKDIKSGSMSAKLQSEYSTLALTMLANGGYIYRGSPINYNMSISVPIVEE
jgi:hypothetical protein